MPAVWWSGFCGIADGWDGGFAALSAETPAAPAWVAGAALPGFGLAAVALGAVRPACRAGLEAGLAAAAAGFAALATALAAESGAAAAETGTADAGRAARGPVALVPPGGGFADDFAAGCLRMSAVAVTVLRSPAADAFMGEPRLSISTMIGRNPRRHPDRPPGTTIHAAALTLRMAFAERSHLG
jgi:hypothetical protein